jgi:hypothetical protein
MNQQCYKIEEIPEHYPTALKKYLTEVSKLIPNVMYPAPFAIDQSSSTEADLIELKEDIRNAGGTEAYYGTRDNCNELYQSHVNFIEIWGRGIYMGNNGCTYVSICDPVTEKVYDRDIDDECSEHTLNKTKSLEHSINDGVPLWKFLGYKSYKCKT